MVASSRNSNISRQITENLQRVYEEALEEDTDDFAQMVERFKAEKAKLDKKKREKAKPDDG